MFSQYTWPVPLVTLGKQSNTIQAFKAILDHIKQRCRACVGLSLMFYKVTVGKKEKR